MHLTSACRSIFIDHIPEEPAIFAQLYKLEHQAKRFGRAIGIGHPLPETVAAIRQYASVSKESDLSFVHVSDILNRS